MRIDSFRLISEMAKAQVKTVELSRKSGISRTTICAIRNGKSCSPETAFAIAKALEVDVTEILSARESEAAHV